MKQAEHDLLADLRRARRSLRLRDMDEPPAVACLTPGQRIADAVATVMGSWSFIIVQSAILFVWITANLVGAIGGWDPYPFILLNLALSFQAAYAAPVIMMNQNRQQDIDRKSDAAYGTAFVCKMQEAIRQGALLSRQLLDAARPRPQPIDGFVAGSRPVKRACEPCQASARMSETARWQSRPAATFAESRGSQRAVPSIPDTSSGCCGCWRVVLHQLRHVRLDLVAFFGEWLSECRHVCSEPLVKDPHSRKSIGPLERLGV